jgi:hypothetical protein
MNYNFAVVFWRRATRPKLIYYERLRVARPSQLQQQQQQHRLTSKTTDELDALVATRLIGRPK